MWSNVGRVVLVFALWGAALASVLAMGASPAWAEPMAVAGAGITLMAWGIAGRASRAGARLEAGIVTERDRTSRTA